MRNLVKYVGIGLLVMGLAACDNSDSKTPVQGAAAQSNASGQPVSLLDGKLSFSLPADMTDQSGKLGTQANNMHVYSDATGQKAVIVIVGDDTQEDLATLTKRLEEQQRNRDPQLQVVTNKAIEVKGQKLQQLDSIISASKMARVNNNTNASIFHPLTVAANKHNGTIFLRTEQQAFNHEKNQNRRSNWQRQVSLTGREDWEFRHRLVPQFHT